MPNLFSKIASQDGTLKLFAGGRQVKSLVPLVDVARCFKFMEERHDINSQIFNLTKDTVTVKEVAKICKKYNPKINLRDTNDEIPNLGFSLSNKKVLKTGFKFLYTLDESIKEMISKWSKINITEDLEHVRDGEKEFIDSRGRISNHELTEPINLIGLIDSKKGTTRANHYHPIQEQKCLVTKGQFIEVFKDMLNKNSPKITQVVNEGQLSVIKPNVAHTMVFSKDTIFLNLVRGEREHDNYGVTHTIKHVFVDDEEKNLLLSCYKFDCRSCGNKKLKRVVSLGYQPLANNLLNKASDKCELYPLEMNYCGKCHNCQLSVTVDPKKMFSNYLYTSSTSQSFRDHFKEAAKKYVKNFKLSPKKSYIIDIGSNDGVALKPFKDMNFKKILGIEPTISVVDNAQYKPRVRLYDFDMTNYSRYLSLSPGNEQRLYWGSSGVHEPGTRNYMGINSKAADRMIDNIVSSKDHEDFIASVRALDRILMAGRYVIPIWYNPMSRLAHDANITFPDKIPIYGDWIGFLPDVWWAKN